MTKLQKLEKILQKYRHLASEAITLADNYAGHDSENAKEMSKAFDRLDDEMTDFKDSLKRACKQSKV